MRGFDPGLESGCKADPKQVAIDIGKCMRLFLGRRVAFQKLDKCALLKALWVEKKVEGESGARRARNGELFHVLN